MSEHNHVGIERHCDVAVIGGSAAGLAAALQLGRQRRSVIVVDTSEPRNAPAAHMHGYLGHEAIAPQQLTALGRDEVRSYGGEVLPARAVTVTREGSDRFRVELVGGHSLVARRVLAATGILDYLPDIDGLADHWGRDVIHCPFCHGYEVRDQRIVQLVTHPSGLHTAQLFRQLSAQHTLVVADDLDVDDAHLELLSRAGVRVVKGEVGRIVTGDAGLLTGVELTDGERLAADAVVVGPRFAARVEPFAALGLVTAPHPSGLGDHVEIDGDGQTAVAGLYAAGTVTDPSQQVLSAAAHGSRVGAMISIGLAREDLQAGTRSSGNESDWDHRYGHDQVWSGNPNGTLVAEAGGLPVGRALDVGAGEGGDAMWLADHGWTVTATDISQRVLDRLATAAGNRGLKIDCRHADANALRPFAAAGLDADGLDAVDFDLVSAMYASIPRTPDNRAVHNLLAAVAPGGTLLVVSHDLEPLRAPIDLEQESRPFDGEAFVRVEDFVAALTASPLWDLETHEKRPRPPGAVTGAGSGLGRAIARELAAQGARVILAGRGNSDLDEVLAEIGGNGVTAVVDVASEDAVAALADAVADEDVSILVNNAGVAGPVAPLPEIGVADWDDVFAVNVRGMFLMCRAFLPRMIEKGRGDVINLASVSGKRPLVRRTPYTASKMAVIGLTATLAHEVGPLGVTVNSLSPGPVDGPRMDRNFRLESAATGTTVDEARDAFVSRAALNRMVTEQEVALAVTAMLGMPGLCGADIDLSAGMIAR